MKKTDRRKQRFQTYFITAKVDVVVEVFARTREEAVEKFEERMLDDRDKLEIFENALSMTDEVKVQTAQEHLGPSR
jgi:hypothetical protein